LCRGFAVGYLCLSGKVLVANEWLDVWLTGLLIETWQVFIILLDTALYPHEIKVLNLLISWWGKAYA
jgi:hypothetical protein